MQKLPVLLEPPTNMPEPSESTEFKRSVKQTNTTGNNENQQGFSGQHTLMSTLNDSQLTKWEHGKP